MKQTLTFDTDIVNETIYTGCDIEIHFIPAYHPKTKKCSGTHIKLINHRFREPIGSQNIFFMHNEIIKPVKVIYEEYSSNMAYQHRKYFTVFTENASYEFEIVESNDLTPEVKIMTKERKGNKKQLMFWHNRERNTDTEYDHDYHTEADFEDF